MRVGVLGASGSVGQLIVDEALAAGHDVVGQTRDARRLSGLGKAVSAPGKLQPMAFDPADPVALRTFVGNLDAVVFALGVDRSGSKTFFSDVTRALLAAMAQSGTGRLIAITGVGAGETRGHGGWLYNQVIFPLFTRQRYIDKDQQEALIRASGLDWTIVRPAPFAATVTGPLEVHLQVAPELQLNAVTREEVAGFIVEELVSRRYVRQQPFIGHRRT